MGVVYKVNKFHLMNTLKFPVQQYHKEYKIYQCNEREWILSGDRDIFHSYRNRTENHPTKKFGLLYVDTENLEEYYKEYPLSKKTS